MGMTLEQAANVAGRYTRNGSVGKVLGFGIDGFVWSTGRKTAVKVFERSIPFERELAVYERLTECGVNEVCGSSVPHMEGFDRALQVVEMTVVRPPFLLDFAK